MRKTIAAAVIAAGALVAGVPSAPAAQQVSPQAQAQPPAPAAVAPHPAPAPPATHTVTVKVSGPDGSAFQVSGAVFGHTGLIAIPPNGSDAASFTTEDTSNLGLAVSVMAGPNPRTCAIEIDGVTTVTNTAEPDYPVTCKSATSV